MSQDIITFTIVFSAAAYTLFSITRALRKRKVSACDGCAGCAAKDLCKSV